MNTAFYLYLQVDCIINATCQSFVLQIWHVFFDYSLNNSKTKTGVYLKVWNTILTMSWMDLMWVSGSVLNLTCTGKEQVAPFRTISASNEKLLENYSEKC